MNEQRDDEEVKGKPAPGDEPREPGDVVGEPDAVLEPQARGLGVEQPVVRVRASTVQRSSAVSDEG